MATVIEKPRRTTKRTSECAVRRNISLTPELDRMADTVVKKYAFANFSDYVQGRMRKDMGLELPA